MTTPGLTINRSTFPLKDGSNGVLAVFIYAGDKDPRKILDWAVKEFTKDCDVPYIDDCFFYTVENSDWKISSALVLDNWYES